MNRIRPSWAFLAFLLSSICTAQLSADVIGTKSGARIVGKITKIEGGSIMMDTDFAGTVTIKQSEVITLTTDGPVAMRLASGTQIVGKISSADGALQIVGANGTINTSVAKVAASWAVGGEDPAMAALRRHWVYDATVDLSGTAGNKSQLGTAVGFRATLAGLHDTLAFYTAYNRQVSDAQKSADQFKAGSDYSNNFNDRSSKYVRDEGGFDRIKDVDIYNTIAGGYGYDFIKEAKHVLTGRVGLSFRFENYKNPLTSDVKSAGLDFGFNHENQFSNSKLVNRLFYVPAFQDFSSYRATHESFYELPLANPAWKLRFGVSNDYNNKPGQGVEKLDTAYFTRLLLSWK